MNTRPPRVSTISQHPANQPSYGYWTKVLRNEGLLAISATQQWIEDNTTERVVIGHTWMYFENAKDATYFNLTH